MEPVVVAGVGGIAAGIEKAVGENPGKTFVTTFKEQLTSDELWFKPSLATEARPGLFALFSAYEDTRAYDMKLDVSNLEDVLFRDRGWQLAFNDKAAWGKLRDPSSIKVGIVGVYNRGKTTVTNLLSGRKAEAGMLVHTEGMSCVLKDNFAFLDTAGQNQPLDLKETASDTVREITTRKLLGDIFAQNMVVALSDLLVIVVNQLTLEDQRYERVMEQCVAESDKYKTKKIIVVHNLKDVEKTAELDKLILKDIIKGFSCKEASWGSDRYWSSPENVAHVVLARAGSEAAKRTNEPTLKFLMNYMQAHYAQLSRDTNRTSLLHGVDEYVNDNLAKYFENIKKDECKLYSSRDKDGLRLFIKSEKKEAQLKNNAQVTEWQVIWGATYELDYEVMKHNGEVLVNIDLPGIFSDAPSKLQKEKKFSDNFVSVYRWSEARDGKVKIVMQLTVYTATKEGKGPRVVVWATRDDKPNEKWEMVSKSRKRGDVDLTVDVKELLKMDAFESADVYMGDNGVLTVSFKTLKKTEIKDEPEPAPQQPTSDSTP